VNELPGGKQVHDFIGNDPEQRNGVRIAAVSTTKSKVNLVDVYNVDCGLGVLRVIKKTWNITSSLLLGRTRKSGKRLKFHGGQKNYLLERPPGGLVLRVKGKRGFATEPANLPGIDGWGRRNLGRL